MAGTRYYWLKLPEDFFRRGYIRRLRLQPDGDRLTVIYLEMLLAGLKTGGRLEGDGAEDLAEELALELFENPQDVRTVLELMTDRGKIRPEQDGCLLTDCEEMTGSETSSARRMRGSRLREQENREENAPAREPSLPGENDGGTPAIEPFRPAAEDGADTVRERYGRGSGGGSFPIPVPPLSGSFVPPR